MLRLFPLLFLLLAVFAHAEPLEALRARHQMSEARLKAVESDQERLRTAQEGLAAQIAGLKANQGAGLPGWTDVRLDPLLKAAHELAERLEDVDRRVAEAQRDETAQRLQRLAALDAALVTESVELSNPTADVRAAFERMKALVGERGQLMAEVTPGRRQVVELPELTDGASADDLRALADEATDNAERVRTQLGALEERLQALQIRRRVLRAAIAFERDSALFADDERNRRLVRSEAPAVSVATPRPSERGNATDMEAGAGNPEPPPADPGAAPQAGGQEGRDDAETDRDGVVDNDFAAEPPPTGAVAPGPVGVAGTGSVVFETALDPALLADNVEALSPAAVADQIRAIEAHKATLSQTVGHLEKRRKTLEERVRAMEVE